jgi:hypothetical protein
MKEEGVPQKKFHIVFVVPGAEYTTIAVLASVLKQAGFKVSTIVDECLFDDKNYVTIPWLAKALDRSKQVIQDVVDLKPDFDRFYSDFTGLSMGFKDCKRYKTTDGYPDYIRRLSSHSMP